MPSENSEVADTGVAVHQEYQDMTGLEETCAWALASTIMLHGFAVL